MTTNSLQGIARDTAPTVESEEGPRVFDWYSQVKLRQDMQLTGANAQKLLLCRSIEREKRDPNRAILA